MRGIPGWVNMNLRGRKGQQGFTLIELLVVVTILGILAGIVTLSLVGLTTHANVQACNTEYKTVQAALDAYMANQSKVGGTATITAETAFTNNMKTNPAGVPLYNEAPTDTAPNYTRNGRTQFFYTWDAYGRINGIGSDSAGASIAGCLPI
jgi:prepilin-type N-terminal cleavage/methylation domain-containing protein